MWKSITALTAAGAVALGIGIAEADGDRPDARGEPADVTVELGPVQVLAPQPQESPDIVEVAKSAGASRRS